MVQAQRGLIQLVNASRLRIGEQIRLEEALFRASSSGSWCVFSQCQVQQPTVVMGISGKPKELVDVQRVGKDNIPVLRRFTGGGTVIVNPDTLFVSFIVDSKALLPGVKVFPREIMRWSEGFYTPIFAGLCGPDNGFHLEDTDYVFDEVKFGGNAQGISGKRWVHHTSFLWDYDTTQMGYLSNVCYVTRFYNPQSPIASIYSFSVIVSFLNA
mmetsp:Transcript_864/g.1186  ORF Transcript_864/g.1186 Transcript_864/m.1186 type:complete len:212 (-) Transcript_864:38-673(-)